VDAGEVWVLSASGSPSGSSLAFLLWNKNGEDVAQTGGSTRPPLWSPALSIPFLSPLSSFLDNSEMDKIAECVQSGSRKGTKLQGLLKNNFSPLRQDTKNLREETPILFVMFLLSEATIFWLCLGWHLHNFLHREVCFILSSFVTRSSRVAFMNHQS
jgi:hypothetical protein